MRFFQGYLGMNRNGWLVRWRADLQQPTHRIKSKTLITNSLFRLNQFLQRTLHRDAFIEDEGEKTRDRYKRIILGNKRNRVSEYLLHELIRSDGWVFAFFSYIKPSLLLFRKARFNRILYYDSSIRVSDKAESKKKNSRWKEREREKKNDRFLVRNLFSETNQ